MPRTSFLLILAFAAPLVADEPDRPQRPIAPQVIADWVGELGDDDFFVREAAARKLWEAGPEATRELLESARDGADEEVAFRARKILWNFDHGILVDTPPEIVRLVEQFRTGNSSTQLNVAKSLGQQGHLRTLTALMRNTLDDLPRSKFVPQLTSYVEKSLPTLFAEQRFDEVREWLDLAATWQNPTAVRQRSAFLLLRDELDLRIASTNDAFPANSSPADHAELGRLLILAGDLAEAASHVARSEDANLKRDLALRKGDWAMLADETLLPGDSDVEKQTFRLVFLRLAGDEKPFAEVAARFRETPSWSHAEALILAERYEDALDVLQRSSLEPAALALASARGEHAAAFESLGLAPDGSGAVEWFRGEAGGDPAGKAHRVIDRGLGVLREITRLRGRSAGAELLAEIRGFVRTHPETGQANRVVDAEWELGYRDEAFEDAAVALAALEPDKSPTVLTPVFDDREATALVCWQWRRRHVAAKMLEETPAGSLAWVADLLGGREVDVDLEEVLGAIVDIARTQPAQSDRLRWLRASSEVAYDRKRYDRASECFAPVLDESPTVAHLMWAADIRLAAEDWTGAAGFFERAGEGNTITTMLQGLVLERAGERERGRELVERAHLTFLGDIAKRSAAASELSDRGFDDEARRQWETILRIGSLGDFEGRDAWAVQLSSARLGNAVSDIDPLRAADLWERYLIQFANTNTAYSEVRRYLAVSHLVHRTRARGLLARDRVAEALAEAKRAFDVWPGNIELALQLVPPLDERGRKDDADALFALVHEVAAKRATDFPANAGGHNDLAWLNAKCVRRLDEALVHAEKAVALEPKSAAYLDTLAEVHFQRGDRERAIEFAQRCLELDPNGEHYAEQLERFRGE